MHAHTEAQLCMTGDHSSQHRTSAAPAMDLATTEEGDDYTVKEPAGVPAWRVVAGNCAAGALAGSAVEAGDTAQALILSQKQDDRYRSVAMLVCT